MSFFDFMTEFSDIKKEIELFEARGRLNTGKLRKVKVFIKGSGARKSYFGNRYKKWGEIPKDDHIKKANDSWTHSKELSTETLSDSPTATSGDGKRKVTFDTEETKSRYEKEFRDSLSYDDMHNITNPTNIAGKLHVTHDPDSPNNLTLSLSATAGIINPNNPDDNKINFKYTISKDKDGSLSMNFDHIKIPSFMQNTGFFKEYLNKAMQHWDSVGIKKLSLHADLEVGGHAWAKYGFDFANNKQRQNYIKEFKKYVKDKGYNIPSNKKLKHSWDIANTEIEGHRGKFGERIGKEFMLKHSQGTDESGLPTAWRGTMDLSPGSRQRTQFEAYVTGKVLPSNINKMLKQETEAVSKQLGVDVPKTEKTDKFSKDYANSSNPKVASVVNKLEKDIQYNDYETLFAVDANGDISINKKGTDRFVVITPEDLPLGNNKILVHNHPRSSSFSLDDLKTASNMKSSEMRIIGKNGTKFSIKRKHNLSFNMEHFMNDLLPAYHKKHQETLTSFNQAIQEGKMTPEEANSNHFNLVWEHVAKEANLLYTRTPSAEETAQIEREKIVGDIKRLDAIDKKSNNKVSEDHLLKDLVPKEVVHEKLKDFLPIADKIAKAGGRAFIVGGFVRDLVMGKVPKDIDVEVHGLPQDQLEKVLGGFKDTHGEAKLVGKAFGVYKLGDYDIAMPRTEKKVGPGHKGFTVDINHEISIEDASRRRDLKFNSMLYDPIEHKILDPHGGMEDISKGQISHTDEKAFAEDPLRVFRVARFKATTGFKVHPETTQLSKSLLNELSTLPKERILGEMEKILLKGKKPSDAFRWLDKVGVIEKMFPELHALQAIDQGKKHHPEGNAFEHTMLALDAVPIKERTLPVMLGILAHDLGKATVQSEKDGDAVHFFGHAEEGATIADKFLKRFTDETELTNHVLALVKHHMKPYDLKKNLNKASLRRLGLKVNIEDLMKVHRADKLGRGKEVDNNEIAHIDKILSTWDEIKHEIKPMIQGRHLIDMGMKPGKHFGEILNKVFQAQLDGEFNTPEDGLKFVNNLLGNTDKVSENKPPHKKEITAYRLQRSKNIANVDSLPIEQQHEDGKPTGLYFAFDLEKTATMLFGERYSKSTTEFFNSSKIAKDYHIVKAKINLNKIKTVTEKDLADEYKAFKDKGFDYNFFVKELKRKYDGVLVTDLKNPKGSKELIVLSNKIISKYASAKHPKDLPTDIEGVSEDTPYKKTEVLSSTKNVKDMKKKKEEVAKNGYQESDVEDFISSFYKSENYASLKGKDNVFLAMPSTSGKNTIPKTLAKKLAAEFGGEVIEDFAAPMSELESKKKGFIGKIRDPQSYQLTKDLSKYKDKNITIVDDVLNTGESVVALQNKLKEQNLSSNLAVLGASETRKASPRDIERITEKLATKLTMKKEDIEQSVKEVFSGAFKQFTNYAEKVIDRTQKDAKEVFDYIAKKSKRKVKTEENITLPKNELLEFLLDKYS
jgi:tRNA nucleotidyltransferase (CCA-adding enzyme)